MVRLAHRGPHTGHSGRRRIPVRQPAEDSPDDTLAVQEVRPLPVDGRPDALRGSGRADGVDTGQRGPHPRVQGEPRRRAEACQAPAPSEDGDCRVPDPRARGLCGSRKEEACRGKARGAAVQGHLPQAEGTCSRISMLDVFYGYEDLLLLMEQKFGPRVYEILSKEITT